MPFQHVHEALTSSKRTRRKIECSFLCTMSRHPFSNQHKSDSTLCLVHPLSNDQHPQSREFSPTHFAKASRGFTAYLVNFLVYRVTFNQEHLLGLVHLQFNNTKFAIVKVIYIPCSIQCTINKQCQ